MNHLESVATRDRVEVESYYPVPFIGMQMVDQRAHEDVLVGVTVPDHSTVGLALAVGSNRDLHVYLGPDELDELIDALQKARTILVASRSAGIRAV